jgi:hypothetical protein
MLSVIGAGMEFPVELSPWPCARYRIILHFEQQVQQAFLLARARAIQDADDRIHAKRVVR